MAILKKWKLVVLLAVILILSGCVTPPPPTPSPSPTSTVTSSPTATPQVNVDTLLRSLAEDKEFSFGYKAYYPLSASPTMSQLIGIGPKDMPELLAQMNSSSDPQYRKSLLFIIAQINDPRSEETLISALKDNDLNGLSAYLLGNYLYRPASGDYNRPESFVRDRKNVLNSLFPLLRNSTLYPIRADNFEARPQVGDLAIASFIRIGGVKNFNIDQNKYRWIGWEIPELSESDRKDLLQASETFYEKSGGGEAYPPPDGGIKGEIPPANKNVTNLTVANGTFTFVKEKIPATKNSSEVTLNFTAKATLDCTKILFIQIVRITDPSGVHVYPGGPGGRMAGRATPDGWSLDRYDDMTSPYYGTDNTGGDQDNNHNGRPGGDDSWMWDKPSGFHGYKFEFETCAICAGGTDIGKCYGCITWGFKVNDDGSITPSGEGNSDKPSDNFQKAADKWNGQAGNTKTK